MAYFEQHRAMHSWLGVRAAPVLRVGIRIIQRSTVSGHAKQYYTANRDRIIAAVAAYKRAGNPSNLSPVAT